MSVSRMQQRRDTSTRWAAVNPVLLDGELGYDTTVDRHKVGDGVTTWNALAYADRADEVAADADRAEAAADQAVSVVTGGLDAATTTLVNDEATSAGGALKRLYGQAVSVARYLTGSATLADAIEAAATAAGIGGTLFIPKSLGGVNLTRPVTLDRRSLLSDGATIQVTAACATAAAAAGKTAAITITATGTDYILVYRGFRLIGPGSRALGVKNAGIDGIRIVGDCIPFFAELFVRFFDKGFDCANDAGHIYWDDCSINNNYYGIYVSKNTYDYLLDHCRVNGNTFANFATSASQGIAGMKGSGNHIGFAPYTFYQEAPVGAEVSGIFLQDILLDYCRFEAVGNAALHTDAPLSTTADVIIREPGFSWGDTATYKITARPRDYAWRLGVTLRYFDIISGGAPFLTGGVGVYYAATANHIYWGEQGFDASPTRLTKGAGGSVLQTYARRLEGLLDPFVVDPATPRLRMGTTGGYLLPGGSDLRRMGGDAGGLYFDSNTAWSFRDSGNGYATRMQLLAAGDLELTAVGKGVIVKSPNGTRYRLGVSDAGVFTATAL